MKPAEHIERSLERLVPAGLSRRATESIESMIDSLAAEQEPGDRRRSGRRHRGGWLAAAAAAVLATLGAWSWTQWRDPADSGAAAAPAAGAPSGFASVGRNDRVGEPEDGGLLADEDGGIHRVLRYQVVEEEVVRDERSGVEVRLSGPREELVLVPVSAF